VKRKMPLAGMMLCLFSAGAAHAADPNLGRNLAATCANCHGTDGNSAGVMPALAGMPKSKLLGTMGEFRSGAKPATIMHQISKGYTDVQLELIADYFASRAPAGGLK
jgi:sulfide dehydrogenase cytochrome subunit